LWFLLFSYLVLSYKRQQLYDIVSDVNAYKKFVPFCVGSRVLSATESSDKLEPTVMEAELTVGFLTFKERYVSKVICIPYESVKVSDVFNAYFKSLRSAGCCFIVY
jgi:coenzyme Q-binding protein COQ10